MIFGLKPYDFVPFFGLRGVYSPALYSSVMLASTLIDAFVIGKIVLRRADEPIDFRRVVFGAVAGFLSLIIKLPILATVLWFSAFGIIFTVWCHLNFAVAPVAWLALRQRMQGRTITAAAWIPLLVGLFVWPCAAYARFYCPFDLRVEKSEVRVANAPDKPIKIAVLADFQTDRITPYEHHVIDVLMDQHPDIILMPGDLFHGLDSEFDEAVAEYNAILQRLDAPLGVYFVTGDVDPPKYLERLFAGTHIQHIDNHVVRRDGYGIPLAICGLYPMGSVTAEHDAVAALGAQPTSGPELRIAFAHHPDDVGAFGETVRVDLFVAGHTHGGQIAFPFIGAPITLTRLPRPIGGGGLFDIKGHKIYVSRGAGMERTQAPRIRFLVPPEVSLITILPKANS